VATQPSSATDDLSEQMRVRWHKRERMLAAGRHPYPVRLPCTRTRREIRDAHDVLPPPMGTGKQVAVTGRVIFLRNTGKLCFATLREGDGTELQAMLGLADVGADGLAVGKANVDGPGRSRVGGRRGGQLAARGADCASPGMADGGQRATASSGRAQETWPRKPGCVSVTSTSSSVMWPGRRCADAVRPVRETLTGARTPPTHPSSPGSRCTRPTPTTRGWLS
jgi:hypothetical protein